MTAQIDNNILRELKIEGLRQAESDEPGWYWTCYNDNDERVTLWVTNIDRKRIMSKNLTVCSKCGATTVEPTGWLIAQRVGKPEGWLIIRCPAHITDHARKLAGLRQEYYHQHKDAQS